jgi:hypothetical protein
VKLCGGRKKPEGLIAPRIPIALLIRPIQRLTIHRILPIVGMIIKPLIKTEMSIFPVLGMKLLVRVIFKIRVRLKIAMTMTRGFLRTGIGMKTGMGLEHRSWIVDR